MIDCLIVVWLLVWNWVKFETFESWIRGNKRTFPNLSSCILIIMNSNSFDHKTLERRWHDFFHLIKWKGYMKIFEFHLEIFQILKLCATQRFSWEKIKWLLQNIWNMSLKFKRIKLKVSLKLFSIWSYLIFIQIIFLQK